MEDWGESGGPLAQLKEVNNHKRSERRFQMQVLLVFSGLVILLVGTQKIGLVADAKEIVLTVLPVFTFVLGKLESKDG